MKKILASLLSGVLAVSLPLCVSASDSVVRVRRNPETRVYTVAGTVAEAKMSQEIMLRISDNSDETVYLTGVNSDGEGNFSTSLYLSDIDEGAYTLSLGAYELYKPMTAEIYYSDENSINGAMGEITSAINSGSGIMSAINSGDNSRILGLDNSFYADLKNNASAMKSMEAEIKAARPMAAKVLYDVFYNALARVAIQYADEAEMKALTDEFWDNYGFEGCKTYPLYQQLKSSNPDVIEVCAGIEGEDMDEVRDGFDERMVLEAIRTAKNIGEAKEILTDYESLFDFSDYSKWSIEKIAQNITGRGFAGYDALYDHLDEKYDEAFAKKENNSGGGGGGGGSSFGGSGSGKYANVSSGNANTPVVSPSSKNSFSDMDNHPWAVSAVENLFKKGIINGTGDGRYEPQRGITREEFFAVVLKALDLYEDGYDCDFGDVPDNHWAKSYIACAYQKGITEGMGENRFGTGQLITREDMCVIILRSAKAAGFGIEEIRELEAFLDDSSVSDYAKEAVAAMFRAGIVNGDGTGYFYPKNNATRAETAVMVNNLLSSLEK